MERVFGLILVLIACISCIQQPSEINIEGTWKHYIVINDSFYFVGEIKFTGNIITGRFVEKIFLGPERTGGYVFIDNYIILAYDDEQDHVEGFISDQNNLFNGFLVYDDPNRIFRK